jgi:hypothetical protein
MIGRITMNAPLTSNGVRKILANLGYTHFPHKKMIAAVAAFDCQMGDMTHWSMRYSRDTIRQAIADCVNEPEPEQRFKLFTSALRSAGEEKTGTVPLPVSA